MTVPGILVTNDDGIHSEGLRALAEALAPVGEVTVVAPDRERSAAGHALTLHRPLRVSEVAPRWYRVDGTPTDCVTLAIMGMLKSRPRLVVAGINLGTNLGDDVTYSGTVSAAMEGTLLGIPAFAISQAGGASFDFTAAAAFARRLATLLLEQGLPPDTLLNVNIPAAPPESIRGIALTRQGRRAYRESVVEKLDPRGKTYYWIGGSEPEWECLGDSDYDAVMAGKISVTPLRLDLTHYEALRALRAWEERLGG